MHSVSCILSKKSASLNRETKKEAVCSSILLLTLTKRLRPLEYFLTKIYSIMRILDSEKNPQ